VTGRDRQDGPHRVGEALWSPQLSADGRDYYANMRDVRPGDIILHLTDNEAITGISVVAGPLTRVSMAYQGRIGVKGPATEFSLTSFGSLSLLFVGNGF
jgi:hypothetical protein